MSEIFNWLKKAETGGKKTSPHAVPTAQMDVQPLDAEIEPADQLDEFISSVVTEPVSEPLRAAANLPMMSGEITFDLDLADRRVRSVLDPSTMIGEQFRLLRARLSALQKQKGAKILLVTSAVPGEGKTFVSCSLAGILAQEPGKCVTLVDADLRRPSAGKNLGMTGDSILGLADVLKDGLALQHVMAGAPNSRLYILPAGESPQTPSELLSSPRLDQTLKTLKRSFDWVIVDSPPVLSLADTSILAPLCDAILLIIRANSTPAQAVKESVERIGREKICGIVMNRAKTTKSSYYYHRYYHA
jgi:capsular exopolysaccharide synthesis family protein